MVGQTWGMIRLFIWCRTLPATSWARSKRPDWRCACCPLMSAAEGWFPRVPTGAFHSIWAAEVRVTLFPGRMMGFRKEVRAFLKTRRGSNRCLSCFDAILADDNSALLGVCHTFGVLCCWSGIATPTLRGSQKGGKSTGILENMLTQEGQQHPWFRNFSKNLPDGQRLRIVDNRLYDLIPTGLCRRVFR